MCPAARIQQEGVCYCTDLLTIDWTTQILAKHVFALLSNEPQKSVIGVLNLSEYTLSLTDVRWHYTPSRASFQATPPQK